MALNSRNRAVAQPGLARYLGVVEVVGSNPAGPILENPWISPEFQGFFSFSGPKFFESLVGRILPLFNKL